MKRLFSFVLLILISTNVFSIATQIDVLEQEPFWFGSSVNQYGANSIIPSSVQQMIDSAPDGATITVTSAECIGTINISNRSDLTIIGAKNSNTILKGVMNAPVFNIVNSNNITIKNFTVSEGRNHHGGGFYISNCDDEGVFIENCIIKDNATLPNYAGGLASTESGAGIYVSNGSVVSVLNTVFYNNYSYYNYPVDGNSLYSYCSPDIELTNCSFMQTSVPDDFSYVSGGAQFLNCILRNPIIDNSSYNHCCSYSSSNPMSLPGNNNIATTNPMFVDEANHDYRLLKGSPLIGKGYDSIYNDQNNPDLWNQDLCGIHNLTNDIGACAFDLDRYATYSFSGNTGYNWVSFPVINNYPPTNAVMANFFSEYSSFPSYLQRLRYQQDDGSSLNEGLNFYNAISNTAIVDSRKGYKIGFNQDNNMNRFHGYHIENDAYVEIPYKFQATWIGYFSTMTQEPRIAFGAYMEELYFIQHKNWTMVRERPKRGSPWIMALGVGGVTPSISYGDMVIVKRFDSNEPEDEHFQWWHIKHATRYSAEKTTYFQYEEEADYTAIFVEIDSTLGIKEVAIYANDECKGAAVVENDMVMIQGYLSDVPDGTELELRTWDNSRKTDRVDFNIFNQISNNFEPSNCVIKGNTDYYRVKLGSNNDPDNNIDTINSLTINNYPNPFNPETTISFNNPQTGKVSLSIYNIKGQLVKSLFDDEAIAGPHSVVWNGKDNRGKSVASGIYFAKIKTGTSTQTKKMLLMK